MNSSLNLYDQLIASIDSHSRRVEAECRNEIKCSSGCSSCCIAGLTVFPVEAHIMRKGLEDAGITALNPNGRCVFLRKDRCVIYESRPVVCRTQGLPLIYGLEDDEPEISVCTLNFTETGQVDSSLLLDMDRINALLANINIMYARENGLSRELAGERISFDRLLRLTDTD